MSKKKLLKYNPVAIYIYIYIYKVNENNKIFLKILHLLYVIILFFFFDKLLYYCLYMTLPSSLQLCMRNRLDYVWDYLLQFV